MKILFIGDIYGNPGISVLEEVLPSLKEQYNPNLIIVNGENIANGRGINKKIYKQLMTLGICAVTMGNWVWGNSDLLNFIDDSKIVRPLNFHKAPGKGYTVINYNGKKVLVINALGRVFMNPSLENPFFGVEKVLNEVEHDYSLLDFHAEATSEKVAIGHYLDGKIDAIVGTHTHIQTADERKLPKGTLYITDVGMTGALNGVIGVKKEIVIDRFLYGHATPNEVEIGTNQLNAVILDLDLKTIQRIHVESETRNEQKRY